MIANPIYLSHFFVEVNELLQVQENGVIRVNLPDKTGTELFVGKEINFISSEEYIFYGELDPCDELKMGYIHLIAKGGNVFGQINIEDEIYELQDFGDRKNVLFKIDPSIYTDAGCGTEHGETLEGKNEPNIHKRSGDGCDVRVLFLFTAAAEEVGNPHNSANLFIQQTNQSVRNSDADVRFTLAGVQKLNAFREAGTASDTRDKLQINPNANQLRNDFQADLVVLLTDGNWITPFGQTLGISFLNNWGNPDFGYVVVELDAGGGNFTCTHEIAHDFGCKHGNDNRGAPNFVFTARSHSFNTGWWPFRTRRSTIMNAFADGTVIMHFSNPDVEFKNRATGVAGERDNAAQLSAQGCTISNYRDFIPPFGIRIDGPLYGDNQGLYTWCLDVTSCKELASVTWEYSLDGFNYSTSPPFPIPFPIGNNCVRGTLPWNQSLWIRATAVCSNGDISTDFLYVYNYDEDFPCGPQKLLGEHSEQVELEAVADSSEIYVFPNPSSDELNIVIDDLDISTVEIFDQQGRLVYSRSYKDKWELTNQIDVSSFKGGAYWIRTQGQNCVKTKIFIKYE